MEITSDTDGSIDDGNYSNPVGSEDGHPDTGAAMEYALTHDISLDSIVNTEDEDIDLEDEHEDSDPEEYIDTEEEGFEVGPGEEGDEGPTNLRSNHGFDGVELGVVPPPPTRHEPCGRLGAGDQRSHRYTAGCVWTKEDWSCSYDAVFMAFWSLYEQSSSSWRDNWIQHTPDWNTPLSNNFDHLIILADTPVDARDRAGWFSHYRDRFRDQLSRTDPRSFPRRGPLPASASRILGLMFGRDAGPYLEQYLVCSDCGAMSWTERETCFLTTGLEHDRETPISLHTVWTSFIERTRKNVRREATCSRCQGQNKVRALEMPDAPWIWFEWDRNSSVEPSLVLTFDSPSQRLSYSLRAIIYAGGNHFSIRFREQSGGWWKYDGRVASGVPQPDDIRSKAELLMNGTRFACTLIYRRDGH